MFAQNQIELPPLRPLFKRLAELSSKWSYIAGPCYLPDGVTEWALDSTAGRDAAWMRAHLALLGHTISTVAELGWAYNWSEPFVPLSERWAEVKRGRLENEDKRDEQWVSYGPPHRAYGPTDLHALLSALVAALEAQAEADAV